MKNPLTFHSFTDPLSDDSYVPASALSAGDKEKPGAGFGEAESAGT